MKKVKIMLLSLLVLAVAGGAMAFNAKFNQSFCTTATIDIGGGVAGCPEAVDISSCPIITGKKLVTTPGTKVCYTNLNNQGNCNNVTTCTVLTTIVDNP